MWNLPSLSGFVVCVFFSHLIFGLFFVNDAGVRLGWQRPSVQDLVAILERNYVLMFHTLDQPQGPNDKTHEWNHILGSTGTSSFICPTMSRFKK